MTTANPERTRPRHFEPPRLPAFRPGLRPRLAHALATRRPRSAVRPRSWFGALRAALDRPLTSYYLLLGASALLLTIGLIMVLSASSVYSYEVNDGDSYAVVRRQLLWVLIGLPLAWVASRLPHRWIRRLAYPGYLVSLVLLLLTAFLGVERQRQPELARSRAGPDPAVRDRQARDGDLGRAHLRQQGAPAGQPPRDHRPGGARA